MLWLGIRVNGFRVSSPAKSSNCHTCILKPRCFAINARSACGLVSSRHPAPPREGTNLDLGFPCLFAPTRFVACGAKRILYYSGPPCWIGFWSSSCDCNDRQPASVYQHLSSDPLPKFSHVLQLANLTNRKLETDVIFPQLVGHQDVTSRDHVQRFDG